jgi:acyl carrier protein
VNNSDAIREIVIKHGRLSASAKDLGESSDLYDAGLTSLATVGVMLALEEHFDIEFPDSMLGRMTFQSIKSIADAIAKLVQ